MKLPPEESETRERRGLSLLVGCVSVGDILKNLIQFNGLVGVWLGFGWIQPQAVLVDSYAVTGVAVVTGMNSLGIVLELA